MNRKYYKVTVSRETNLTEYHNTADETQVIEEVEHQEMTWGVAIDEDRFPALAQQTAMLTAAYMGYDIREVSEQEFEQLDKRTEIIPSRG